MVLKFSFASIISVRSTPLGEKEGSGSGAGSGSIPMTNESRSGMAENMRILWIRIPTTAHKWTKTCGTGGGGGCSWVSFLPSCKHIIKSKIYFSVEVPVPLPQRDQWSGSVTLWIRSMTLWIWIPDPYNLITDPDPALFINGFQDSEN